MTWTLDKWFAARDLLRRVYLEELGRDVIGDPDALTNWLFHMREYDHDEAWLRDRFRESDEYRQRHGNAAPTPPRPTPAPASGRNPLQITNEQDGPLLNRMYSYWSNAFIAPDGSIVMFVGHQDGRPRFFRIVGDDVTRLGPLLPNTGTGEGWYWDALGRLHVIQGSRLLRFQVYPFGSPVEVVIDISQTHPGCDLWQAHSSATGRTHTATVRQPVPSGSYPYLGTVCVQDGVERWFPADTYALDESQPTTDDAFLLIKSSPDDDNLVVNLASGEQRWLRKGEGALGHSDCGDSIAVGADRANGTCALIDFRGPLQAGRPLYNSWNIGHISLASDTCIAVDATTIYRVAMDGSGRTPIAEHGMVVLDPDPNKEYEYQVFANLDRTGRVACYMSNMGTGRFDAFLLRLG